MAKTMYLRLCSGLSFQNWNVWDWVEGGPWWHQLRGGRGALSDVENWALFSGGWGLDSGGGGGSAVWPGGGRLHWCSLLCLLLL